VADFIQPGTTTATAVITTTGTTVGTTTMATGLRVGLYSPNTRHLCSSRISSAMLVRDRRAIRRARAHSAGTTGTTAQE
jgi:hypothetical protein